MSDILDHCTTFKLDQVEAELQAGYESTVQFDKPIGESLLMVDPEESDFNKWPIEPSVPYLKRLDAMCAKWGERLTVRFYAHYGQIFDGSQLQNLPNIHSLSADSLDQANNLEAIAELKHLSRLHLGVFEQEDKALLSKLPIGQLRELTLSATNTKALDLAPLGAATQLRKLYLDGHYKNIAVLGGLTGLEEFIFNAKTGLDLAFINGMTELKSLKFNLGGTKTIEEIELLHVQDMAFTETRGLCELGDMQRFPSLRRLLMQDQQHISQIKLGAANTALEHLWFYKCKKINALPGIEYCSSLKSLRWLFTEINPASLALPDTLTHLHMLSGKRKSEAQEIAAIEELGYIVDDHPDASFFYK
ncbi:MAG: hypothetical protein ABJO01_15155 [Parasphingorhabdus sp.]|uniref:hypothetical protein n=1 Tax=Parasphingorhabdus sp. TaxID=2709688 RepID=UPI003299D820